MTLKLLRDVNVTNKTVLYRSPYDIGTEKVSGEYMIKDDSRIKATLPTLQYLLDHNCKIVVLTYVGRPGGKVALSLSTKPHAESLSTLLNHPVKHLPECAGESIQKEILKMHPKDIIFLENVRFHKEENEDDDAFAKELAKNGEIIVFDGFPQAHRKQASTTGILRHLPSCAGFYLEKEVNELEKILQTPNHPLTLIVGGIKAETKVPVITNFLNKAGHILIGGRLVLDKRAQKLKTNQNVMLASLTKDMFDIDSPTISSFTNIIESSKMVIWAGPMGKFEDENSSRGTRAIVEAVSKVKEQGGISVVAGGDTIEALNKFGDPSKISHISLAGGATLEFLAGKKLPVLEMLKVK